MYKPVFEGDAVLTPFVEHIVAPNMQLSTRDEEVFEDQPEEFMTRDMEGGDMDTRRRSACDLINGLALLFADQVSSIALRHVGVLITAYHADKGASRQPAS